MDLAVLRDPIWQFWGFVATIGSIVVGTIVSVVIYLRTDKRRQLTYWKSFVTAMAWTSKYRDGSLKLLWNEKEITNLYLVAVRIANTGTEAIKSSDFEVPITIGFPSSGEIVSVVVGETTPPNLLPNLVYDRQCIELETCLLNKGDSLEIVALVQDYGGKISVQARIVGIKAIRVVSKDSLALPNWAVVALLGFPVVLAILFGMMMLIRPSGSQPILSFIDNFSIEIAILILFASLLGWSYTSIYAVRMKSEFDRNRSLFLD